MIALEKTPDSLAAEARRRLICLKFSLRRYCTLLKAGYSCAFID
jgi:hypothetical protein